jgi:hypothetical protein
VAGYVFCGIYIHAVPTGFLIVWVILVVLAYVLRMYCVSAIQTQSPKLYERLGKPAYISRYSWGFLRKVSKYPEFQDLTERERSALRFANVLDIVLTIMSSLIALMALRAFFSH